MLIRRARRLYLGDAVLGVELDNTVYALDSSTIDLCLSLFSWAPFRSTKAAIKLHTLLDLRGAIPAFIHISDGKLHDVNVLDMLVIEAGAFCVMDRGYVDFGRLHALQQAGAFFVTRAKSPMDARRVYSAATDRSTGVIGDQQVMLNGHYSAKKYPQHLRRIRFKDPQSGKTLIFLTNHMARGFAHADRQGHALPRAGSAGGHWTGATRSEDTRLNSSHVVTSRMPSSA